MTPTPVRPLARYAHPCPVCRRESLPGAVEGMYTREGLARHLLQVHGETALEAPRGP